MNKVTQINSQKQVESAIEALEMAIQGLKDGNIKADRCMIIFQHDNKDDQKTYFTPMFYKLSKPDVAFMLQHMMVVNATS